MRELIKKAPAFAIAVGFGAFYGIFCQLFIRAKLFREFYGAMTFGFVFILPFVLGFCTLWWANKEQRASWPFRVLAPWGTCGIALVAALIIGWEGAICMIMAAVVYLPLASLGGIVTGIVLTRMEENKLNSAVLATILALPILSAAFESRFELPVEHTGARTSIEIHAPAEKVWQNIIRVPPITEPLGGFFYKMGFPKPIEATLSHEGVGGVRNASFEHGLRFIETVDVWEPLRKLSFSIAADASSTPTTTLDEHVVVGGRYFDVLRGTYEIEERGPNLTVLHLSSNFRVSTRFNFYAGIWATFLMSDIQRTILEVIRSRCERPG